MAITFERVGGLAPESSGGPWTMQNDGRPIEGDTAAIVAAVRVLASDAHAVLARSARGEADSGDAALADVLDRAEVLRGLVDGDDQLQGVRLWLEGLRRRVLFLYWPEDPADHHPQARRPGRTRSFWDAPRACPAA